MSWHLDWASAAVGGLATWAVALVIVVVLAKAGRRPPRAPGQLPAVPRWAATKRDDALETDLDDLDLEYERLINGETA